MKEEKNLFITAGFTMLFPVFVFAQHDSDSIQQTLKEINIVATKTEKNKLETGRSVTVLTQKDLQGSVYSTLAELLSMKVFS